jgi:hypothetical protein
VRVIPGIERRVRAAEGVLDAAAPARTAADERLAEALERVPPRLLFKMLALADAADDEAAAMLADDAELVVAIEGLMDCA